MSERELFDAVLRLLDDELPAGEVAALADRLRHDERSRREVAALLLQIGQLREVDAPVLPAEGGRPRPAVLQVRGPAPAAAGRVRFVAAGAALAAAAVLLVALVRRPARPASHPAARVVAAQSRPPRSVLPPLLAQAVVGRVVAVQGAVRQISEGAHDLVMAGWRLRDGAGLETVGPAARATLVLEDDSQLGLGGNTTLAAVARQADAGDDDGAAARHARVVVGQGELAARIEPLEGAGAMPATFLVPSGQIAVDEGRLRLDVGPAQTRLRVDSGRAEVAVPSNPHPVAVEARQLAVLDAAHGVTVTTLPASVLFVRGGDQEHLRYADRVMVERMQRLGAEVTVVLESRATAEDLTDRSAVVISASCNGRLARELVARLALREVALPIVTCENAVFDVLGMTGPRVRSGVGRGASPPFYSAVDVLRPDHPLAAGFDGQARVARSPISLAWGEPAAGAMKIATLTHSDRRATVFAYERGAVMAGGVLAPARRASCFIDADDAEDISESGWRFFDAAVRWAAGF